MAKMYVCEHCEGEVTHDSSFCGNCGCQLEDAFKALIRDVAKRLKKIKGVKVEGDVIKATGEKIKNKVIQALKRTAFFNNIAEFQKVEQGVWAAKIL